MEFFLGTRNPVINLNGKGRKRISWTCGQKGNKGQRTNGNQGGAVSPMARDKAKMVPVKTPGNAWGSTCSLTTCQRVAPRANAACRMLSGTARRASRVATMTMGSTSSARVNPPRQNTAPASNGSHQADKSCQTQKTINNGRYSGQVRDINLNNVLEPAALWRTLPGKFRPQCRLEMQRARPGQSARCYLPGQRLTRLLPVYGKEMRSESSS